ncbi:WD40 repeat-like protein [Phellopilus nigrolimitatus]|nr:WD40 repeat-like protein [Phellopilus nigrolimitatus]
MVPLIQITADEVNHIIYSYLQDSGFLHTAFSLRSEGRLEQSPHFDDYVPRGELVELLTKALLYTEVETHCKGDGLITDCRTPFSLLKRHVCAVDMMEDIVNGVPEKVGKHTQSNGVLETMSKRKADMPAEGDNQDRRVKRSMEPETADANTGLLGESSAQKERLVTPNSERDPSPMSGVLSTVRLNGDISRKSKSTEPGPGDGRTPSKAILSLDGHSAEVFVCAWNPVKPGIIATGSKDATVRIWDLPDPPDDPSQFAAIPEKGPIVLKHLPNTDQRDITSLDWNADGTLLATGSYDSILRVWTVRGAFYMSHPQHQKGPIFATRFSKSGRWLLSASLDGTACVWDVAEKKLFMQFRCHAECCLDVDWLDDDTFASCGADKCIHIMRIGIPNPLRTFEGHEDEINQIKFNPSKTRLASCSDDQTARVWVVGTLASPSDALDPVPPQKQDDVLILEGHMDSIGSIGWCPNVPEGMHEILATTSFDGTARLWDATTGECLRSISDHKRAAYTLTFSPEGKFFATGSGDGWLYIYDIATGKQVWSWYAGADKTGIYEIDWQQTGKLNRIAMCLESRAVGIIDVTRVPALMASAT